MDLLLDTHVFIWWRNNERPLGHDAKNAISDPQNRVFISAVSVWEIAIKRRIRKLAFTGSPSAAITENGFFPAPISPLDAEAAGDLAWPHNDPFDRLLIAQAVRLGAVLVTADSTLRTAPAALLWAA